MDFKALHDLDRIDLLIISSNALFLAHCAPTSLLILFLKSRLKKSEEHDDVSSGQ